jgi:GNAT superfamily N-acetyltransferase
MRVTVVHTNTNDDRAVGEMIRQSNRTLKFDPKWNDGIFAEAVLLFVDGNRAAILRYNFRPKWNGGTLNSHGTYVWPAYRQLGLGTRLWREALRVTGANVARVHCVSDRGWTLALALKRSMPNIRWEIHQVAIRRLRNLAA